MYECSHVEPFDSSVGRALHRHRRGRGFKSHSAPEFFSGLCSSSVVAPLALMTVIAQLLLMDKINENLFAYRKMVIMNNLKRRVLSIVMFMLADGMLVKDLQKIINKHEMEKAWP